MGLPLYVRIWLAVVLAVATLSLLVGWAWRMAADPPLREIVVRDPLTGQVIGTGERHPDRQRNRQARPAKAADVADGEAHNPRGPEFTITMQDGRHLSVHLPRPPRSPWSRPPFGFLWTLGLVAVAVALATYPIIRKLTRRLERLQQGVEQWGAGALDTRVPVQGNDEVAFLAQRFNTAAERIEALVHSHKSLLANASHELRSPLARIRMGLELMQPAPGVAPADAGVRLELYRNIAELDQLIDEILLASRLDAKELDLGTMEEVDLVGLVAEEAARVNADFEPADGVTSVLVPGVNRLLRRAVRNLLENARRYGGQDVSAELWTENGQAVVVVNDRGPGVPEDQRERIFEPFYRMPGASESHGGVGLGLALVRSIAERHGGQVSCGPREGGGARFRLVFPLV